MKRHYRRIRQGITFSFFIYIVLMLLLVFMVVLVMERLPSVFVYHEAYHEGLAVWLSGRRSGVLLWYRSW